VYFRKKFLFKYVLYFLKFDPETYSFYCSCDGEYFLDDLGLKAIPKGDWFCASCTKSEPNVTASTKIEASKSISSSRKRNIDTVVDSNLVEGRRSTRQK
jgi:hypothetical protein